MQHPNLPVKRRSVKKGAFSTLFVNVARKRHRASTAAPAMPDSEGDVPNVGVARALGVILAIHVVAIVGIFIHSKYFETKTEAVLPVEKMSVPAQLAAEDASRLPKLAESEVGYTVETGDTYASIAAKHGVDVTALKQINDGMELQSGRRMRIPPKQILAMDPPAVVAFREANAAASQNSPLDAAPPTRVKDDLRESAPMVDTVAATGSSSKAVLIKPNVTRQSEIERASTPASRPVSDTKQVAASPPAKSTKTPAASTLKTTKVASTPAKKSSSKLTVKSGDTLWSIAKANGTTPNALMKANGIKDPSKLRTGMQLVIP